MSNDAEDREFDALFVPKLAALLGINEVEPAVNAAAAEDDEDEVFLSASLTLIRNWSGREASRRSRNRCRRTPG